GALGYERVALLDQIDEVPVQAGIQPSRKGGGDVRREHRLREQDRVEALVANELRKHVDPRRGQRRRQTLVVRDVHDTPDPLGSAAHAVPHDDASGIAERARFREHTQRRLGHGTFVMLEEDEQLHSTRFSARNSTIASAAFPSSSTRRLSPRAGGGASASTVVRDSPAPPTSAADSVSRGFAFAPMIPFNEG